MTKRLASYEGIVGTAAVRQLRQLGERLAGKSVVHINSTRTGGGVAEILVWLVDLLSDLGLRASWETIEGNEPFFGVTKSFHNGMQGTAVELTEADRRVYEQTNAVNAERLRPVLEDADFVFVHDPQPAALLRLCPRRRGKWVWRCHIDASRPYRPVWKYLREVASPYDASVFSMALFAQALPHPQFIIAPSIDPLSEKNRELSPEELDAVRATYGLDPERPLVVQVSRFDRFKDPVGVIEAYKLARRFAPLQLVLAGGGATDDPEGAAVLDRVQEEAAGDPDIHVLFLPGDAHRTINALQRLADIVIQKSTREGFGLTVTEALWKGKPVIGGDTGGIRLQVINHHTGFLVGSPQGAALRIRYLLHHHDLRHQMGSKGREFVRENYLLTRHVREYLTLMLGLSHGLQDRLVVA